MDWGDFNAPDGYRGFFPFDEKAQLPVTDCASVMVVADNKDPWEASVSVADIDPGTPVMDYMRPETVRGEGMKPPMVREDSRNNDFQEFPWDSSGLSCDLGVTGSIEPDIWSQDNVVAVSDVRVRSGMLCLLNFTCPGNSVRLPVVGGPHWMGMAHLWGVVWDLGGECMPRLRVCCDFLCLIALFRTILLCDHGQSCFFFFFAHPGSERYWVLENN